MEVATFPTQLDYETEHGKPMPSFQHARLQSRINIFIGTHYFDKYEVFSELTLDTPGEKSTPDLSFFPLDSSIDFNVDMTKTKEVPLATVEILSPTQALQTLIDKTNDYFSFGVKSCWIVIPSLQSIYVFKAPFNKEVFVEGEILHDPNLDIQIPMDLIFSRNPAFKV